MKHKPIIQTKATKYPFTPLIYFSLLIFSVFAVLMLTNNIQLAANSPESQIGTAETNAPMLNLNNGKALMVCTTDPVVTTNADSGAGSLRMAVIDACDASTITFDNAVVSPITLTSGQITIGTNLTISGPGANLLSISGNNNDRVFEISSGFNVTLNALTITGGNPSTNSGGGVSNFGTLNVTNSTISNSSADNGTGGGIYNGDTLNVSNSTFSGNSASFGGAIYNDGGKILTITNSTLSGNSVTINGGGISNGGTLTMTNLTVYGNSAQNGGGGIANGNTQAFSRNSIFAGNTSPTPDFNGTLMSQGYNLIGDTTGTTITGTTTGNILNQDPLLGALADNGGPTQTYELLAGSPALDKGSAANDPITTNPIITDQRGLTRPYDDPAISNAAGGDGSDIGAFEFVPPPPCLNVTVPTGITELNNSTLTVPINVDDTTGFEVISFDFTFTFDETKMTPLATPYDSTGTISSDFIINVNPNTPGTLVVSGFGAIPLSGSGTLLNLKFTTNAVIGSTSALSLTAFQFNEGTPCVDTTNGDLTIISGTVSGKITYANAAVETPVVRTTLTGTGSVPVSTLSDLSGLYSQSGFGSGAYTETPSKTDDVNGIAAFDASLIAQHVIGLNALNATQLIVADVSANGTISSYDASLIAQYVVSIANPGITGTWKFTPVDRTYANVETDQINQDFQALLMGEVSGDWAAPASFSSLRRSIKVKKQQRAIGVNVPDLTSSNGESLTIPLEVRDTTGRGIIAYQYDLIYDQDVIMPNGTACDLSESISPALVATCNTDIPGRLKVAVFGALPINDAGVLMNLKFDVVGVTGDISPLTLREFKFNEGSPLGVWENGQVEVVAPTAASTSVSGKVLTLYQRGIPRARVTMTDQNGNIRSVRTNQFGYYRFDDIPVGEVYVFKVISKGHTFLPQTMQVDDALTNLNFTAQE